MKKVALVVKESNYDIHGARVEEHVRNGRMAASAIDALKLSHQEHVQSYDRLRTYLSSHGWEWDEISRKSEQLPLDPQAKYIVTLGGDGTLLYSAQYLQDSRLPIIGIRSTTESVGYLCAYNLLNLDQFVVDLNEDKLSFDRVERLYAVIQYAAEISEFCTPPVLNDFLYTNANPSQTTRYRLSFGQWQEAQRSSGVWIATPLGSTAAIHAAGGVMLPRTASLFQFRTRELFRPQSHRRELEGGLFDPDQQVFRIENFAEHAILALDGQHASYHLSYGDTLEFYRGPHLLIASPKTR